MEFPKRDVRAAAFRPFRASKEGFNFLERPKLERPEMNRLEQRSTIDE
jgi:hypothetical protein